MGLWSRCVGSVSGFRTVGQGVRLGLLRRGALFPRSCGVIGMPSHLMGSAGGVAFARGAVLRSCRGNQTDHVGAAVSRITRGRAIACWVPLRVRGFFLADVVSDARSSRGRCRGQFCRLCPLSAGQIDTVARCSGACRDRLTRYLGVSRSPCGTQRRGELWFGCVPVNGAMRRWGELFAVCACCLVRLEGVRTNGCLMRLTKPPRRGQRCRYARAHVGTAV